MFYLMKTLKIFISGAVQGVFFRQFIKDKADEIGVKGYVRNLEDGKVEVVIEGKDKEVNEMLKICRKGAPHSQVKELEIEEIPHQEFKDFKVLHI